jgi:protein-tyrosine phosphatase
MIDIHTHILPEIDDGSRSLDESLEMARIAVAHGTTTLIATPHVMEQPDFARAEMIAAHVVDLQGKIDEAGIGLRLLAGAEVFPKQALGELLSAGAPLTLAGTRYVLIDTPFSALPLGLEAMVFALQTRGFMPILAHPERVAPVQEDPRVLEALVARGLLLQVTAGSVLGRHGEQPERTAEVLLAHRWVSFIASDAHGARARRPAMDGARALLAERLGEEEAAALTEKNPQQLLADQPIVADPLPYTPPRRRSWWWPWPREDGRPQH